MSSRPLPFSRPGRGRGLSSSSPCKRCTRSPWAFHPLRVTRASLLVHNVGVVGARRDPSGSRPRVVVLGGGFGGIGAAKQLRKSNVDVVLVDGHDYHTFQPLLYQVATGLLEQPAVGHPIRDLFHKQDNIRVHQDRVKGIDLEAHEVRFGELEPERYDYLVLALGAQVNYFGVDGAEHAFPLYTLAD